MSAEAQGLVMSTEQRRVGWIGTGRMGHAMVERLLAAGHDVHVWNRTRSKAADLAALGASIVDTIAELADCDIVFTVVSADEDLAEVTLGDAGLLRQSKAPGYLVDCSTVSAQTSEEIRAAAAERGTYLLAAPVSGNAKVVRAGLLSIVVSGDARAFGAVEPLLRVLGRSSMYIGEGETARLVKLAHNMLLGVVTQSLAEVAVLVERGGVSRAAFLEFINSSVLGSMFTRYKTPALVNLDLTPTFTTSLLRKDFDLGLAAARELGVPAPVAAATYQLVQAAIGRGHGADDFASLLVEHARSAGVELSPEYVAVDDGLGTRPAIPAQPDGPL
jgi:3-hydroxyisobutyrate dehydrogenase-like beta-hydroxyacid dehydrogenase